MSIVIETMRSWLAGEPVWPLAKIIEVWGEDFEMYRSRWDREFRQQMEQAKETGEIAFKKKSTKEMMAMADRFVERHRVRDEYIREFGFAIPCAELLDELAKHEHVVEVGAGSGYMTRLMMNRGINATGSDADYRGQSVYPFQTAQYDPEMVTGTEAKTMVRRYPKAAIFCSWPTLKHTWFRQMLRAMSLGQTLIVIREDACAEDSAWEYLDGCFRDTGHIAIPAFDHMNDYAQVCVKKRKRPAFDSNDNDEPF